MDFVNIVSIGIIGFVGVGVFSSKSTQALVKLDGNKIKGTVKFEQINSSTVTIELDIQGFEPNTSHGFHVHANPIKPNDSCDLAGPHFDSGSESPHGGPHHEPKLRHVGDLGNILADSNGLIRTKFSDYLIKLDGPNSIIGKTIVIHEFQDDFKTIESSGKRISCGLIESLV
jgi:Cu-Zn family superoxide dismutase